MEATQRDPAGAEDLNGMADRDPRGCLKEIFLATASNGLSLQSQSGAMPAGHNGPYRHPETPVRNTAHWMILFARAWEMSGDLVYREAGERALDYLLRVMASSEGGAVRCRIHRSKDASNGVVGQAWIIEGLAEGGRRFRRSDALDAAVALFVAHPYRFAYGAWEKISVEGRPRGFDWTFNHQLWFCAAGALLLGAGREEPRDAVYDFANRFGRSLWLAASGLIEHANSRFIRGGLPTRLRATARACYLHTHRSAMRDKSIGYHCFNTYALALIHRNCADLGILQIEQVVRAIDYACSRDYWDSVGFSAFGFPYNPPGLEAAFTIDVARPECKDVADFWIRRQIMETYDSNARALVRQSADPATAEARTYEAARLL